MPRQRLVVVSEVLHVADLELEPGELEDGERGVRLTLERAAKRGLRLLVALELG